VRRLRTNIIQIVSKDACTALWRQKAPVL